MSISHFFVGMLCAGIIVCDKHVALAQDYPNRPIRVVTSPPGGSNDFIARTIAQGIAGLLGQPIIVDNRASEIAPEIAAKAPPDGYTLLVAGNDHWILPLIRKASYDPIKDFSPITIAVMSPNILVVHPSVPVKSVPDLIQLAKTKPGALNYASASIGSSSHLAAELFKAMAGVNIVNVVYRGSGPAIIGLLGGEVQLTFASAASAAPHIKADKLRALAVTSARPSALVPGLTTVAATLPGYETLGAGVILLPAGAREAIVSRLNREIVKVLNQNDMREKLLLTGQETIASSPEQLAGFLKAEMLKWGKVIKNAGIRAE